MTQHTDVAGPSLYQVMAVAKAIHATTPDADDWDSLRQCEVDALRGRAEKVLAALAAAPTTQPGARQQSGVGNGGFDHKTAADFLAGKTVSDEAMRKFVTASRWAHDNRVGLQETLLSVRHELASREAEIALLKTALMDAEAAAKQGGAA